MRMTLAVGMAVLGGAVLSAQAPAQSKPALDNPQVRAYKVAGAGLAAAGHVPAVLVFITDSKTHKAGDAVWTADAAGAGSITGEAPVVVVEPLHGAAPAEKAAAGGSAPGDAAFTGMSFKTLFENADVTVIRARMEVGAKEAFHTHASDTVVVHLTGGSIEDVADGVTKVNRWAPGDVEFEGRGSSHSARNVGAAVDVVLVVLKPVAGR